MNAHRGGAVSAPEGGHEWREWATRVEEYDERFGEPVEGQMYVTPSQALEAAEEALDRGEPISYPEPPLGADT